MCDTGSQEDLAQLLLLPVTHNREGYTTTGEPLPLLLPTQPLARFCCFALFFNDRETGAQTQIRTQLETGEDREASHNLPGHEQEREGKPPDEASSK